MSSEQNDLNHFLAGKSTHTLNLFHHFVAAYEKLGNISLHPAKTMIGVSNGHKRIAWITQFGKNFLHVVFPFKQLYNDNLCFQKIAQVPDDNKQFNHHYRMYAIEDLNEEVLQYMLMAYKEEG